jgi:multidrug efflux pump subunit AcrA (membrane-fusion protein)
MGSLIGGTSMTLHLPLYFEILTILFSAGGVGMAVAVTFYSKLKSRSARIDELNTTNGQSQAQLDRAEAQRDKTNIFSSFVLELATKQEHDIEKLRAAEAAVQKKLSDTEASLSEAQDSIESLRSAANEALYESGMHRALAKELLGKYEDKTYCAEYYKTRCEYFRELAKNQGAELESIDQEIAKDRTAETKSAVFENFVFHMLLPGLGL